jgi:hypothetical protein
MWKIVLLLQNLIHPMSSEPQLSRKYFYSKEYYFKLLFVDSQYILVFTNNMWKTTLLKPTGF